MASGQPALPDRRRVRLLVAYDGSGFHGFAPNPGVPTVLGTLNHELERIVREPVALAGAGRTDAGVHAWGQVVSGDLPAGIDLDDLTRRLNKLCGPQIAVRAAAWASPDFHARFSALARTYRYHVWNDRAPNPLAAATSWHVAARLSEQSMQDAGEPLVGEHDFSSFCRRPSVVPGEPEASLVRRVTSIEWTRVRESPMLRLEITATSFCHQMVRSVVGTLVDVGRGRRSRADVVAALAARDRSAAPTVAPPHGLILWHVSYPDHLVGVEGWAPLS